MIPTQPPKTPKKTPSTPAAPAFAKELAGADRCVLCGMCLPQCPTYALQRMEGDSPRGRITLMQGLAQGHLQPDSLRLREHLEGCLGCRSCEAVCPAGVQFGDLMDHSRSILRKHPQSRWQGIQETIFSPLRRSALRRRRVRSLGALAARLAVRSGMARLFPPATRIGRLLRHVSPSLARQPALDAATNPAEADVWLFTGCMDAFFTGPDLHAALDLLAALGVRVAIPAGQVCCGALDQHLGRLDDAAQLQTQNIRQMAGRQPVLVLDSGCQAQLREYDSRDWRERVTSLTGFLSRLPIEDFRWRREPVRVALHLPCTLRNVNREADSIRQLLERLPGVDVRALAPPHNCCGAGGTAMLSQPEAADTLGQETLQALDGTAPDYIVSANVGCSVHLRALQEPGIPGIVSPARFLRDRLEATAQPAGAVQTQ